MSMEDVAFQLMEEYRLKQLKKNLSKTKLDYDQLLNTVPLSEIERYLRKKKLDNMNYNYNSVI
jgi:hypothetical protein